jgi:hypothetical protein
MRLFYVIFCSTFLLVSKEALASLAVREIFPTKKNVYVEHAIYQSGNLKQISKLSSLRHSSNKKRGYERIVLDFSGKVLPETYVFVSSKDGKINIDLSNTKIKKTVKPTIKSNLIREMNFFPLANNILSMEIFVDKKVYTEVFQLKSPTRLVIDLKK